MDNPGTILSRWTGGVNSFLTPDAINVNQYAWGTNVVNRGGLVQARPGFDWKASLSGKVPQGATIFVPDDSRPVMLIAVDGMIYGASFPFTSFSQITGFKFRSDSPVITFCNCLKQADVKQDGTITTITPKRIVIIQDGQTMAGYYDGSIAMHLDNEKPFSRVPIGLWMAFSGQRLWVANGSIVYASDLASPDTFTETTYLAERSSFVLPGDCTGIIETSDEKALLAFTENTTSSFHSSILVRTQWQLTPGFQQVVLPNVGCISGRSPINQYGVTWWFSRAGFLNLDAALQSKITSKVMTFDAQMTRSKRNLASMPSDLASIATGYYENYLLVSVPSGGRYNEHTWVADQTPIGQTTGGDMAWVGIWTGVRPVQWMRTIFHGRERIYFLSFDSTPKDGTNIHVWEAFKPSRLDNGGRIACQFETGLLLGTDLQRFLYAEIDVTEILGTVEVQVYVGGMRGPWLKVKDTVLQAEIGSLGSVVQPILTKSSILQAFKPQSRFIKTEEFSPQELPCLVESEDTPGKDKGFQVLVVGRGRMAVKSIKLLVKPDPSKQGGQCSEGEDGDHNIINEQGETIAA